MSRRIVKTFFVTLLAAGFLTVREGSAQEFTPYASKNEPGRADMALAEQPVEMEGLEFYPRSAGPRGPVSFARYGLPLLLDEEDLKFQSIALRPGISPGKESFSVGVSVQVQW